MSQLDRMLKKAEIEMKVRTLDEDDHQQYNHQKQEIHDEMDGMKIYSEVFDDMSESLD